MSRRLLVSLVVATSVALSAAVALAATKRITPKRVGGVKLDMKHSTAQARGLVGRQRKGCELAGPGTRSARLRAPLKGSVDLTRKDPRRIRRIVVTGGAEARGVGVGDALRKARKAYPKARLDDSTQPLFGVSILRVPKDGGGRLQFLIRDREVEAIGVPSIPFCE